MSTKYFLSAFILFFFVHFSQSQSNFQSGILPSINLNKKLAKDWGLNFKVESRQQFKEGDLRDKNTFNYEYLLTDFSGLVSKKIQINKTISTGFLIRFRGNKVVHRFIQQYTIVSSYDFFRLSHRFVTDETFAPSESMQFRIRYRASALFPLNGRSVDAKEYYFKINHEYLNAFQNNNYDLEIRVIPFLGYAITQNNKFEVGVDYRVNSFLENNTSNRFWMSFNWYLSI